MDSDSDEWGSTNVPESNYAPPTSPGLAEILSQINYPDNPPLSPSPGSTGLQLPVPGPDRATPPNSEWSQIMSQLTMPGLDRATPPNSAEVWSQIRSQLTVSRPDLAPPPSPSPHPSQPGPSEDRYPPGFSPNPDALSATVIQPTPPGPPQSPGVDDSDPEMHSLLNADPFPTDFWNSLSKDRFIRRISGSDAEGPKIFEFSSPSP
ncbi:hypothetical protein F5888DRAFT_1723510 [Russula emetica]|nr:hypothetical protein F5888DRAFT_1723510 [Russula emetica]